MTPTSRLAGGGMDQGPGGTPLPIGARLGDFEITGVIRHGGFGVVYAGIEHSSHRKVAIREYFPSALADRMADGSVVVRSLRHQHTFREGMQGFMSEARTLAALAEPALVQVLRFWEQHGTAYVAMPLYEGRTLKDVLRDTPKPSEAWLKAMLAPLLDALATLHQSNCYPCDVTPDNILMRGDGTPLLFDFGTARRIVAGTTEDVTVVLKPGFAPIEQFADDPSMPEGPWTDIYAVAAVLRLAIAGKPPLAPTTRIVSDTMPPLGNVTKDYSERFLEGIDRALAVRPEHRPQSIAEFRTALGIAARASGAASMEPREPSPPAPVPEARNVIQLPEPGPNQPLRAQEGTRIRVLGDGSKVTPTPSAVPAQGSPPLASQTTSGNRSGGAPWKLIVSLLVVVGLAGGGLLVWILSGPDQAPAESADSASAIKPAPTRTQPRPPAAASPRPAETATPPMTPREVTPTREISTEVATPSPESRPTFPMPAARAPDRQADVAAGVPGTPLPSAPKPPVIGSASPGGAASEAGPVASIPGGTAAPAARTGKVQFSIKPWGEILVDGRSRGVSPPIKELSIPEGRHRIEVRNSTFPGYASEIDVKAGSSVSIAHSFKAP